MIYLQTKEAFEISINGNENESPIRCMHYQFLGKYFGNNLKVCVMVDKNANLHLLSNKKLKDGMNDYKSIESENVQNWLNNRDNKIASFQMGVYLINKENFTLDEFCNCNIDSNIQLLIVKILDPLKEWVDKHRIEDYKYLSNVNCDILDYLTLRPTTWISVTVLDAYITYLCIVGANIKINKHNK